MPVRKPVSISLRPELHAVAERRLASGRYYNFSELVPAGLRHLDEREQDFEGQKAVRWSRLAGDYAVGPLAP